MDICVITKVDASGEGNLADELMIQRLSDDTL